MSTRWFALPFAAIVACLLTAGAAAQTISLSTFPNVGAGLQSSAVSVTLSTSQHGGVTVHVASDTPSIALVSSGVAIAGTSFIDVFVPNGTALFFFYLHGVEATTGSSTITASAPGFTSGNRTVNVVQPALEVLSLSSTIDTLDPVDPFQVRVGLPNAGGTSVGTAQNVRAGSGGLTATITNSSAPQAELETTAVTGQTVSVTIAAGATSSPSTVAAGGVALDGLAPGVTLVSASIPGFIATTAAAQVIMVTQPSLSMSAIANVGSGLQSSAASLTLSASQHGGVTVHIKSVDPSIALVSHLATSAGTDSVDVFVPNGQTLVNFHVHALEDTLGAVDIIATAPGFTGAERTVAVVLPAVEITSLATTIDTLDPSDPFLVRVGTPAANLSSVGLVQSARAGGPGLVATVVLSNPTVGELETTPLTGSSVSVPIAAGNSQSASTVAAGGVAFDGLALGSTSVSATIPGFLSTTNSVRTVSVTQPNITLAAIQNVGAGLQGTGNTVVLSASQHGGVTVHIESSAPTIALVSTSASTPGAASVDVFLANGSTSFSFFVSGLENITGVANIDVSCPGFTGVSRTATIVQPALEIGALTGTIDTLDPSDPFVVRVGLPAANNLSLAVQQAVRAGSAGATASITHTNPAAAELETTALTGQNVTVNIAAGNSQSPTNVAAGGVALDGLALGSTTVSASIPGFIATTAAAQTVTVTQPSISLTSLRNVGSGLQDGSYTVTLSASQHGGVTMHIASGNPALVLVSAAAGTPGTAFIDVAIANGIASTTFYVHGLEAVTGTTTITMSCAGFISDQDGITVEQPACDIQFLGSSIDESAPGDPFVVRVGLTNAGHTGIAAVQAVRAGGANITATLSNSNASVARLVTTPLTGQVVTVNIPVGSSQSASTVAAGGVEFDGLASGSTLVSASIPGFIATGAATQSVNVFQWTIVLASIDAVGAGLQSGALNATLGVAQHGGVTLHIESSDPALALVSSSVSVAGSSFIDIAIPNGVTTVPFVVQGMNNTSGPTTITAAAPGFTGTPLNVSIVAPALQIEQLADSIETAEPHDPFVVRVGVPAGDQSAVQTPQVVRAGGPAIVATISSSNASVAELHTSTDTTSPVQITIPSGESSSPGAVASGGVELFALSGGTITVSATSPGFVSTTAASKSVVVNQTIPSGVASHLEFALAQNSPNPFNPSTRIDFTLARDSRVRLDVFDVQGKRVQTLVDAWMPRGGTHATWNGRDARGTPVGSGIYFYRLSDGVSVETRKMTLLK